jgi:hypothetical protein
MHLIPTYIDSFLRDRLFCKRSIILLASVSYRGMTVLFGVAGKASRKVCLAFF